MTTLTVTSKGQVTFKQGLLKHLGISPGQTIEVDKLPDGKIIVRAAVQQNPLSDFIGCLQQSDSPTLSIDEINDIAACGWAEEQ
jgi:antitoxin PrlF